MIITSHLNAQHKISKVQHSTTNSQAHHAFSDIVNDTLVLDAGPFTEHSIPFLLLCGKLVKAKAGINYICWSRKL
jgi:hypothetical protein